MIKSNGIRWARNVALMLEKRTACRSLVEKSEVTRPLRGPRRNWMGNIKMGLGEIKWGCVDRRMRSYLKEKWRLRSRKLRLTTVGDPPR
jgi:hypothetical protein